MIASQKNKGRFHAKSGQDDLRALAKLNPEKLGSERGKKSEDSLVNLKPLLLQIVGTGRSLKNYLVQSLLIDEETKAREKTFPAPCHSHPTPHHFLFFLIIKTKSRSFLQTPQITVQLF